MKKWIVPTLLVLALLFGNAGSAVAASYDYALSNLRATSQSVLIDVTKVSDRNGTDVLFFAVYDEYNTLIGLKRELLTLPEQGKIYTVEQPFRVNKAVKVKAFIWDGMAPMPRSKMLYKTTQPDGDIEFGGDIE